VQRKGYTLQGSSLCRVQSVKHQPQAKPIITNKGFSTLALLYVSIAIEIQLWDGMDKNGHGQSIKWMK